jgi:thymidylate kinase
MPLPPATVAKQQALDYWESGMDLGLSRDMFDSFLQYQSRMRDTFRRLQRRYGFDIIDAERSMDEVNAELREDKPRVFKMVNVDRACAGR